MRKNKSLLAIIITIFVAVLCISSASTVMAYADDYGYDDSYSEDYTNTYATPSTPNAPELVKYSDSYIKISWSYWGSYVDGVEVCLVNSKGKPVHKAYRKEYDTYKIKGLKANKTYKIALRAYVIDDNGKKIFSEPSEVLKATTSPKQTELKSVRYTKAGHFKASWKRVSGVSGYVLQYSTSKKFSAPATCTVIVKGEKTTSKEIGGLAGKTYYVRVMPFKSINGYKYASKKGSAKSVNIKKGLSLKAMINYTKTDLSGRDVILQITNKDVDIKNYKTTYDRLKAIYNWHAKHYKEFDHCLHCNATFNDCVDALYGTHKQYDDFIWIACDNFKNGDGSVVMHKWSVLYISGVKLIFDPRLQGYTGNYTGNMYFGISPSSPVGKHYIFDGWYMQWRSQSYSDTAIKFAK